MNLIPIITLLIFPGIFWALIDAKFSTGRNPSIGYFTMHAIIFGVVNYYVLFLVVGWGIFPINRSILNFDIFNLSADGNSLTVRELRNLVGLAFIVTVALSVIWLKLKNLKFLNRLFMERNLGMNTAADVWTRTHLDKGQEFVYVRIMDFENKHICQGYVRRYSESEKPRELLLNRVLVSNLETGYEYELPYLYLSPLPDKIWMEFPPSK